MPCFTFTAPNTMRFFRRGGEQSRILSRTDTFLPAGESVRTGPVVVMVYDHREVLALQMGETQFFLLVQQIDEADELALSWGVMHGNKDSAARATLDSIRAALIHVLPKYFQGKPEPAAGIPIA